MQEKIQNWFIELQALGVRLQYLSAYIMYIKQLPRTPQTVTACLGSATEALDILNAIIDIADKVIKEAEDANLPANFIDGLKKHIASFISSQQELTSTINGLLEKEYNKNP